MQKQTHQLVNKPQITVPLLADYMAASERRKRSIVRGCKYRPLARMMQHKEARHVVSSHIRSGEDNAEALIKRANRIENKLADDDFDQSMNEYNADYIRRFAEVAGELNLPNAEIAPANGSSSFGVHGVKVTYTPHLLLNRVTKTNKLRLGAIMLRYARGKELSESIAMHQSAAIFGFTSKNVEQQEADAEKALCITLDAYSGKVHSAPGNSVSLFSDMQAACESIAEWWPNIKPPKKAVFD